MKKVVGILLTAAMLTGNAAMPFTAAAADTADDERNTATRETYCKNIEISELYDLPKNPLTVDIHDYEDFTLEQVLTELCGEYAGVSSYGDYYIHSGSDLCFFMDKNGRIHFLHILYPEIVVQLKEGADIPATDIREALADKGFRDVAWSISEDRRIFRVYGCKSKSEFDIVLEVLQKTAGAESVTGHIALYEDTANYASAPDEVRIISPSGTGADGVENKELMELALSLGFKSGSSTDYQGAPIGDYDIIISKADRHDDINPYELFKYLADNGYRYSTPIATTELAQTKGTVYFCNIPYTLINIADSADEIPDLTHGTKIMTLDDVKSLGKKKHKITWSDFVEFEGEWTSTDSYSHCCDYELGNGYTLVVRGNPPEKPDMVRLYRYNDPNFIDLRYHNADKFISGNNFKDFCNMTEEEMNAYFDEKGMTKDKGYKVWTAESAARAAENYFVSFLVKLPASYTDKNGDKIINETSDVSDLARMMIDNSYSEQFNSFLDSFDVNLTEVCNIGSSHLTYRIEGNGEEQVHRRYLQIDAYAMSSYRYTKDEANDMYADALNYIQLNPQFAGFVLESRIPLYGAEDKGILKGDANNDGQVDMSDAVLIMQALANPDKYSISEAGRDNADIDGDGITVGDAQSIQKHLLGIIEYITSADTIRKMTTDYCADQNVNYTIIPKEKMPEKLADKYVFYKRNGSDINDFSCIEQFIRKNYIQHGIMREIPYNVDDDSELNLIREKLFCYMLENNIISLGINYTDKEQDAINKKVFVIYDWNDPEEDIRKLKDFIANSDINSDLVEFRQSGLE